ncbi:MAG: 50S ribosomal protein L19 [Nitrospinales bacterium]
MNLIDQVESAQMKKNLPDIRVGDTVKVHIRIVEGEKERVQVIEGIVIRMQHGGSRKTITVRKISFGVGVERIFPIHSPRVEKIDVVKHAKVRQARLYYLRELRGKAARLKELRKPGKKKTASKARAKS